MYFFLFLLFSSLAIFFGLILIFFQNPMYSILSLVCCIFFSVMILFLYGIEFMSFIYLVVYIGAIAILFLFMIMMLNINNVNSSFSTPNIIPFFLYLCIFFKGIYFIFLINRNMFLFYISSIQSLFTVSSSEHVDFNDIYIDFDKDKIEIIDGNIFVTRVPTDNLADSLMSGLESTSDLSKFCILYDVYSLYFILAGFILLYAMLGSISLCISK